MEQMSGYLAARLTGAGAPEEISEEFELIAKHCKSTKNDKLLIDIMGFDLTISTLDRFLFGERSQIFTRYGIKVVFVSTPEQINSRKFGVLMAQNRGVNIDAFTDWQAAEEWLLKRPP